MELVFDLLEIRAFLFPSAELRGTFPAPPDLALGAVSEAAEEPQPTSFLFFSAQLIPSLSEVEFFSPFFSPPPPNLVKN